MADAEEILAKLTKQMKSEGEIVKAVLLKTNGEVEEVEWNSTPLRDHISEILGGSPTILGELPGLNVVLTQKRDTENEPENPHKLPAPLHKLKLHGDIFCTHLDEQAEPKDFTKADFEQYLIDFAEGKISVEPPQTEEEFDLESALSPEAEALLQQTLGEALKLVGENFSDEIGSGDIDNASSLADLLKVAKEDVVDSAEEQDEEENDEDRMEEILETARRAYKTATGRDPTVDEISEILRKMGHNVPTEEPPTLSPEEESEMLKEYFTEFWGREPTAEELKKLSAKLPEFKAMVDEEYEPDATELALAHKEKQEDLKHAKKGLETPDQAVEAAEAGQA